MKIIKNELISYLPFALRCMDLVTETSFELDLENISNVVNDSINLNTIKPILRPLSDLTKEIEHNGEKFVPFYHKEFEIELRTEVKTGFFDSMYIEEKLSIISESHKVNTVFEKSIIILNKIFEWHFDVFGLIEKGLAIDINTLES